MFRYLIAVLASLLGLSMLAIAVFGDPASLSQSVRQALDTHPEAGPDIQAAAPPGTAVDALRAQRDALTQQVTSLRTQLTQLNQDMALRQHEAEAARAALDTLRRQRAAAETEAERRPQPAPPVRTRAEPQAEREPPPPPRPRAERPPAPAPTPAPAPRRAESEETTVAVLERLRQAGPEPGQREPPPSGLDSAGDSLVRVRTALAHGQWDQAQRLLQVAQLQLVFRPVTPEGDMSPTLGRATAEVGRALNALGTGNVRQADQHVARAMDEIAAIQ